MYKTTKNKYLTQQQTTITELQPPDFGTVIYIQNLMELNKSAGVQSLALTSESGVKLNVL